MGHGRSQRSHTHLESLVLYLLLVFYALISGTIASRYVWKTGLWMDCQHYSCGKGGSQFRSVYCGEQGEYNYNEYDPAKCQHLPKPKNVQECFKVCEQHENLLRWAITVWSDCTLRPQYRECSIKHGVRYRNVTCVWRETGRVEDDRVCSEFEPKPDTQESCDLKCPQDCVVSVFSLWSINNCDNCYIVNKTRTRALIVPPGHTGQSCPPFTEMIPCDNCLNVYTYKIGAWDECSLIDNVFIGQGQVRPKVGFQRRSIHCIDKYGSVVLYRHCVDYLHSSINEIINSQTCIIPQDCIVSEWSQWSPPNPGCVHQNGTRIPGFMVQSRSIMQIPLGAGKPCPTLVHYIPLKSQVEAACSRTYWKTTGWSECSIPTGSYGCSTGLQTRNAYCVQSYDENKEKPVPDRLCRERRPLTSQTCQAQCDLDCTVSYWTQWSECKVTDCELYLRRKRTNEGTGQRYRTRTILMESRGNGALCPHLSETQTCDPQPCFKWNMTVGECHLLNPNTSPPCGLGIAYRTLSCINRLGLRVADSQCVELSDRPNDKEDCSIPCPRDCILSNWSPWSQCPNLCQEGRHQEAPIQTRERFILAQSGHGGAPCPPNRELTEIKTCPTTIECAVYVWQADPWGPCVVNTTDKQCGAGVQTRDVSCYSLQGTMVNDIRCTMKVKPATSQQCEVPCPVDCQVTDFSDWSACSSSCFEANQIPPRQTRVRYVIQESRFGGTACPSVLMEVKPCNNLSTCEKFYWELGSWSKCVVPPNKRPSCGDGLKARAASCRMDNGTLQPVDMCIRNIGPIPDVVKPCHKSCQEDTTCLFEEWSEWSMCVNGCNGKRFRTRKIIEDENNPPPRRCLDERFYPLDSNEKCLCDLHLPVSLGNWSECILESEERYFRARTSQGSNDTAWGITVEPRLAPSYGVNAVCGRGRRYKVLTCQNEIGEVEPASKCSLKPYEEEMCLIPCPVDCVMSDWSQWTDCSTSCATGTQLRFRHIKQIPSDGGRLCPSLDNTGKETQSRVCHTDCRRNKWRVYKWSPCMPVTYGASCGNGTQSRSIRCEVYTGEGYTNEVLDASMCSFHQKPAERRACYSPCVGECVVSEWTEWTRCKQPCADPNQVQTRTRSILRRPSDDPMQVCPNLLDERFCIRGDNCVEYNWTLTDWTSCLVNNGQDECGFGHRERYPFCRERSGPVVDDEICQEVLGESTAVLVDSCQISCDVDCLLTVWTPWSECSSSCDIGVQTRTRDIVEQPRGNGRQCPKIFEQQKPCFQQGCYTWNVSAWSDCSNHRGVCGHGQQTRNITCVANSGLSVNTSNCQPDLSIIILATEQPCTIPCPGECVVTDWTEWTDCFIHCKDFERPRYTRGVQSRSRAVLADALLGNAPCPGQLWESQPCEATRCYNFLWKTSGWGPNQTRDVWCERSDGLIVTGGCDELTQPQTELTCKPDCSIAGSLCNDTNHCVCRPNYDSVYNRLNVLVECIKMDNSTDEFLATDSVTLPTDGPTNIWMYAVIAAGTLFVIFLAVACYTMSEFFHKGPRPRRRGADEKSLEGADRIDGMIAETEFASCNHVPHGAPIVKSELDSVSVISADRTPPNSVRAPAWNGHASTPMQTRSEKSLNDDSPEFVSDRSVMHDPAAIDCAPERAPLVHDHSASVIVPHEPPMYSEYCDLSTDYTVRNQRIPESSGLENWSVTRVTLAGSAVNGEMYAKVRKEDNVQTSVKQVNPLGKPARLEENTVKPSKPSSESKWGKPNAVVNILKKVLSGNYTSESTIKQASDNTEPDLTKPLLNKTQNSAKSEPLTSKDIVYLNRENSETELNTEVKTKPSDANDNRNSLGEILKTYFDKTLHTPLDEGNQESKGLDNNSNRLEDNETTTRHDENYDTFNESENETLLIRKKEKIPPLFMFKSESLEQEERQFDALYDSDDDSISKTQSLRSQSSMRSRISRLSNLSISTGPVVRIDPDESIKVNGGFYNVVHSHSIPATPKRKRNIAYVTYSSIDTETSETPSSSMSMDSMSPRSGLSETHSDHCPNEPYLHKGHDTQSQKSNRNVAMGSLKHKSYKLTPPATLERDSGCGSMPKDVNCSYAQSKIPVAKQRLVNSVPEISIQRPSLKRKNNSTPFHNHTNDTYSASDTGYEGSTSYTEVFDDDFPTSNDQTGMNEKALNKQDDTRAENGTVRDVDASPENEIDIVTENLLTPYHFLDVKSKRDAFKKQCISEMGESEC